MDRSSEGAADSPARGRKRRHEQSGDPATPKKSRPATWTKLADTVCCRVCEEEKAPSAFDYKMGELPRTCFSHLDIKRAQTPTCKDCVSAHLVASIELKGPERLGCLHESCNATWEHKFISRYLDKKQNAQLNDALFRAFIATQSTFVHCPGKGCQSGGLVDKTRNGFPQLECFDCKGRFCAMCQVSWHKDMTCSVYRAQNGLDAEDEALKKQLKGQDARRCPHCQFVIIKADGCDHMYCDHCRRQFLWPFAERFQGSVRVNPRRTATKKYKDPSPPPDRVMEFYQSPPCEAEAPPLPTIPPLAQPAVRVNAPPPPVHGLVHDPVMQAMQDQMAQNHAAQARILHAQMAGGPQMDPVLLAQLRAQHMHQVHLRQQQQLHFQQEQHLRRRAEVEARREAIREANPVLEAQLQLAHAVPVPRPALNARFQE